MIYLHVLNRVDVTVRSPLDRLVARRTKGRDKDTAASSMKPKGAGVRGALEKELDPRANGESGLDLRSPTHRDVTEPTLESDSVSTALSVVVVRNWLVGRLKGQRHLWAAPNAGTCPRVQGW